MKRMLQRIGGDDTSKRAGNHYSSANRRATASRLASDAAMGKFPMRPDEEEALRKQRESKYKSNSQRGVNVPRPVSNYEPPPRVAFVPHRKTGEQIREEHNNFERDACPRYVPTQSSDEKKDELALRNQYNGRTPKEIAAEAEALKRTAAAREATVATPADTPAALRAQIADELVERQDFLAAMQKAAAPMLISMPPRPHARSVSSRRTRLCSRSAAGAPS